MTITTRVVPSALLLCALAGTAHAQVIRYNYDGLSGANGNWSDVLNWTAPDNNQAEKRPPIDGGNNVLVNFEVVNVNPGPQQTSVNNRFNLANFYTLNGLRFDHRNFPNNDFLAVTLQSAANRPFRFVPQANGTLPTIANNTNGRIHDIQAPIQMGANLTISGSATDDNNGEAQLWLTGQITEVGGARTLTIGMAGGSAVYIGGNNNYTGPTNFNGGTLILGHNAALGNSGALLAISNVAAAPIVRAVNGTTRATAIDLNNAVYLVNNAQFGEDGTTGYLKIRGNFHFGTDDNAATPAPNNRTVDLAGGVGQILELAGDLQLPANTTVTINGDTAPTMANGKIKNLNQNGMRKENNLGSTMVWSGNVTLLQGTANINSSTLVVNGNIGTQAAPSNARINIGDGTTAAALIGRSVLAGPRVAANAPRMTFANGRGITTAKGAIFQPGASPGYMAVAGGDVTMEPGSAFAVTLNGLLPGAGDGFYGQLLLEQGPENHAAMTLQASSPIDRPILGIDLQTWDSTTGLSNFMPLPGMSFVLIDQELSSAPSLYTPMLSLSQLGTMFMTYDYNPLPQGATFALDLPGYFASIDYFGGDTLNDVVLTITVPTPGAGGLLALTGLAALRRKRR